LKRFPEKRFSHRLHQFHARHSYSQGVAKIDGALMYASMARMRYKKLTDCPLGMQKLLREQEVTAGRARRSEPPRRSKYGNVRTQFNGETFDSKAEAEDDQRFRMEEAAGLIAGYARQVSIPMRARRGKRIQLDFMVNKPRPHSCSKCGHVDHVPGLVLMDRKGVITPEWETKRRILEAQLGVEIEVIQH
jgi:hypothetical protein